MQTFQDLIVAMPAQQSKDEIMRMLKDEDDPDGRNHVVAIMKSLPNDKKAEIVEEFQSEEETRELHEILKLIRRGEPDVSFIEDAQKQMRQFNADE